MTCIVMGVESYPSNSIVIRVDSYPSDMYCYSRRELP